MTAGQLEHHCTTAFLLPSQYVTNVTVRQHTSLARYENVALAHQGYLQLYLLPACVASL